MKRIDAYNHSVCGSVEIVATAPAGAQRARDSVILLRDWETHRADRVNRFISQAVSQTLHHQTLVMLGCLHQRLTDIQQAADRQLTGCLPTALLLLLAACPVFKGTSVDAPNGSCGPLSGLPLPSSALCLTIQDRVMSYIYILKHLFSACERR